MYLFLNIIACSMQSVMNGTDELEEAALRYSHQGFQRAENGIFLLGFYDRQ